ncbi:large-conductance mechanosensitive channel protein MscL [Campylobacter concisus]|uniref:large-conductance mechanosensitive channel protein MscL n=1 Tax=Campylobacter concisus TaxID=199 RepID=UPI00122D2CBB|nr:large-conductance mechanosensitive channel protein MscL [Campylobacter concisus]
MSFISEFKEFAMRGNVIDMAVGVVIGGAFGKIVSSLVGDIIMPVVGVITGGVNFTDLKLTLKEAAEGAPAVTINYGSFIQTMVDFLIIAFCIFCVIKTLNTLKNKLPKEEEAAPAEPETPADIALLTEIRDLLKK